MGVNNRARRAAKRRRRGGQHGPSGRYGGEPSAGRGAAGHRGESFGGYGAGCRPTAVAAVAAAVCAVQADRTAAAPYAALLTGPGSPVAPRLAGEAAARLLTDLLGTVLAGGWGPSDLAEVVARRAGARHVPLLAAALAVEADRHPPSHVAAAWRADLAGLGPGDAADPATPAGMELVLGVCAVLTALPAIAPLLPPPGRPAGASADAPGTDTKLLSRVRSLLAKAESTDYPEEAEALSAKAQELISRYALDRLVAQARHDTDGSPVEARRLWIDPPYVLAKAMLISAVAGANRCQSVAADTIGFTTVVGEPSDLDAVELLVASLLVQADAALLRYGRQADRWGTSRTKSFRRSFLMAYAGRIGERLRAAARGAVEETGRAGELVPVLRRQAERVEAATEALFPEVVMRGTTISNGSGWAAGRAAADLARIDAHRAVTDAAS